MTFERLLRLFGLILMIGGLLITLVQLWLQLDSQSFIAAYFNFVGFALIAFGLIGLYLAQYKSIGGFGFFSFIFLSISLYLWLGYIWFQTFVLVSLEISVPELVDTGLQSAIYGRNLAFYSLLAGIMIFAGLSLWKGILSRWGSSLLILAPISVFVPYGTYATGIMAGIAFLLLGINLRQGKQENTTQLLHENKLEAND